MDWSFLESTRIFNFDDGLRLIQGGPNTQQRMKYFSWGVENVTKLVSNHQPHGMSFMVNGLKFQGLVILTVNFLDYYDVRFVKSGKVVHEVKDMFVSDVPSIIDEYVEKQEDYAY
jgi:hypothetical protein